MPNVTMISGSLLARGILTFKLFESCVGLRDVAHIKETVCIKSINGGLMSFMIIIEVLQLVDVFTDNVSRLEDLWCK